MPYIGKQPTVGNFQVCDAISVVNGQAAYTLQVGGVNVAPESANHMLVSLNGILQKPGSSFTISGSTMTFASNLATGDVIDFVQILGNVLDIGQPSDDTVTAAKLNNDIISGQTALAATPADTDEFLISDAGTIKRIDYSYIKSANTPAFEAYLGGSGGQSVSDNTVTLVQANTEVYDTDSAYDTSTYRFTPQTAGKYFVYGSIQYEAGSNDNLIEDYLYFKLNGSNILETQTDFSDTRIRLHHVTGSMVVDMNGSSDYVELYGRINTSSGSGQIFESNTQYKRATYFGAYRIIT